MSSPRRHPLALRLLHWAMAAGLGGMVWSGWKMTGDGLPIMEKIELYQTHKSMGVALGVLVWIRVAVRILSPEPMAISLTPTERRLSRGVQGVLYAAMILMPVIGWVIVSASPTGIALRPFDLVTLPFAPGVPRSSTIENAAAWLHATVAVVFMVAVALHVAGALSHGLVGRTGVWRRIWFGAGGQ